MHTTGAALIEVMTVCIWAHGWLRHGYARKNHSIEYRLVRVPAWLSWACGRPLLGSQLELGGIIEQGLALVLALVWPVLALFRLDPAQQVPILALAFMITAVAVFAAQTAIRVANRLRERRDESADD